jgi:hypothetical protein
VDKLYLRPATAKDVRLLFDWVNDISVRKNSFSTKPISFEDHEKWFQKKLLSAEMKLFVLMSNEQPIGQVRVDASLNGWEIDYSIVSAYRGGGYGKHILMLLEEKMEKPARLIGKVKKENLASRRTFLSLSYTEEAGTGFMQYEKLLE